MNNAVPKNDIDGPTLTKRKPMMLITGELTEEDVHIAVDHTIDRGVPFETLRRYVRREKAKAGPEALLTQKWILRFVLGLHNL